eukprot:Clim_evm2s62 gene=Clim_evmTU2s62
MGNYFCCAPSMPEAKVVAKYAYTPSVPLICCSTWRFGKVKYNKKSSGFENIHDEFERQWLPIASEELASLPTDCTVLSSGCHDLGCAVQGLQGWQGSCNEWLLPQGFRVVPYYSVLNELKRQVYFDILICNLN